MANPYESPKSDVATEANFKRSIWWKIYFFIFTILGFIGSISFLLEEQAGIVEYLQLFLFILSTIGLFGFTFLKKIFIPVVWLWVLVVSLLFGVFYEQLTSIDLRQGMTDMEFYVTMAIGWLISIPGYIALYLYSKSNKHPWISA